MVESQNNSWLTLPLQDEAIVIETKHPVYVMIFGVVSSNGNIIPLFIFQHGLSLNTEAYLKIMEELVWQQEYEPCHTSWRNLCWLW